MFRRAAEVSNGESYMVSESRSNRDKAVAEREKGNELYRAKKIQEAIEHYQASLEHADKVLPSGRDEDDVWNDAQDLKIKVSCNMAQCHLMIKKYRLAVLDCNAVLVRDKINQKALWRRSQAYMKCGKLEEAQKDLRCLSRLNISEKMTKRVAILSEKIASKRKIKAKKQGKALRRFFSSENEPLYEDKKKNKVPSASPETWSSIFLVLLRNMRSLLYFIITSLWIRVSDLNWWQATIRRTGKDLRSIVSGRALID